MATEAPRPAFYALSTGGWRDYVTLLHPPYTAWHLSYVVIGAALAPELSWSRLLPALAAFFLAVGVGAHALDELNGRPLRTGIASPVLVALAATSVVAAVAIGVVGAIVATPWLGVFVAAGAFIVVAYNLELAGGRFHDDAWFALAWGTFPLLTAYVATAERIDGAAVAGGAFAFALSLAQRRLSTPARDIRRHVTRVDGAIERRDGTREPVTPDLLLRGNEGALRAVTVAVVTLALALVIMQMAS